MQVLASTLPLNDEGVFVQLLIHVQLFATPWTAAHQASLSFTFSWSFFKFMSIESVMPSNHLILSLPLLLLPSNLSRVFSNERVEWKPFPALGPWDHAVQGPTPPGFLTPLLSASCLPSLSSIT